MGTHTYQQELSTKKPDSSRQRCGTAPGTAHESRAWPPGTLVNRDQRETPSVSMNFSMLCRFWFTIPVLCGLFRSVHAFAFNINGGRGGVGARRRGLGGSLGPGVEHCSGGVAVPQRAQGQATVAMSAGTGSTWSWSQAAATALAAMQVQLQKCTYTLRPSRGLLLFRTSLATSCRAIVYG